MLSSTCFNESVARHIVRMTQHWDIRISYLNFTSDLIPGELEF